MKDIIDIPNDVEQALRDEWNENEYDYRDMENYEGSEIVYGDTEIIIVADYTQSILPQLLRDCDAPYQWVKEQMNVVVNERMKDDWDTLTRDWDGDPIVFPRGE